MSAPAVDDGPRPEVLEQIRRTIIAARLVGEPAPFLAAVVRYVTEGGPLPERPGQHVLTDTEAAGLRRLLHAVDSVDDRPDWHDSSETSS